MIGVAGAQGFAIARPMGAEEIPAFAASLQAEPDAEPEADAKPDIDTDAA